MRSIVQICRDAVATMNAGTQLNGAQHTFVPGLKSLQNIRADKSKLPIVFLDRPIKSPGKFHQTGYMEPKYNLVLGFYDQCLIKVATDAEKLEELMLREALAARQFMLILSDNTTEVREVDIDFTLTEDFYATDAQLSGWILEVTVTLRNDEGACIN